MENILELQKLALDEDGKEFGVMGAGSCGFGSCNTKTTTL